MLDRGTLRTNLVEIALLAVVAAVVISSGWKIFAEGLLAQQLVVWVANIVMLITVWAGLRWRKQSWGHFGLSFEGFPGSTYFRVFWQSLAVFLGAMAGFIIGSVVAAMILGEHPSGGPAGYEYLQGNLPMLLFALTGVFIASSFGEEVIYRGFLMTRIAEITGGNRKSWIIATLISSVVFGLIHFGWGVFGIIQTTFMGLALSIGYLLVKKNLWVLVLAHAYMDTILLVQLYLTPVQT